MLAVAAGLDRSGSFGKIVFVSLMLFYDDVGLLANDLSDVVADLRRRAKAAECLLPGMGT